MVRIRQILKTHRRSLLRGTGLCLIVLVLCNALLYFAYNSRTYPSAKIAGLYIGSINKQDVPKHLSRLPLVPQMVVMEYEGTRTSVKPSEWGISLDQTAMTKAVAKNYWLPMLNLIFPRNTQLTLAVDTTQFQQSLKELSEKHTKQPTNARPVIQNGAFVLASASKGKAVDQTKAKDIILTNIANGRAVIKLPSQPISPKVDDAHVLSAVTTLQKQQKVSITYTYQDKSKQPSSADIANWYSEANGEYTISDAKILDYLTKLGASYGVRIQNGKEILAATKDALKTTHPLKYGIIAAPRPTKTYAYCTAVKGVDASNLPTLDAKLASTFKDGRGWGLEGQVIFTKVTSGCNMTVWLTAANQMTSFGSICDSFWSCTVSPNVIINNDRWQGTSPAWIAAGGSLDDYRSMVINHEVGHWLGFNHKYCGGAGQPAPVMQQQSINLQGCVFNPWPLASEREELRQSLGL